MLCTNYATLYDTTVCMYVCVYDTTLMKQAICEPLNDCAVRGKMNNIIMYLTTSKVEEI